MKNLKDSILEKLRVDDIIINNEFPIDGTLKEIIEFLEGEGFVEEEDFKEANDSGKLSVSFDLAKSKCLKVYGKTIYFADTSKKRISKDNPIFLITNDLDQFETVFAVYYFTGKMNWILGYKNTDKRLFLRELNKRFGWK